MALLKHELSGFRFLLLVAIPILIISREYMAWALEYELATDYSEYKFAQKLLLANKWHSYSKIKIVFENTPRFDTISSGIAQFVSSSNDIFPKMFYESFA